MGTVVQLKNQINDSYFQLKNSVEEKLVLTGNPVRANLRNPLGNKAEAAAHFGLDPERPVIFVFGGSLGARSINRALMAQVDYFTKHPEVQLIWQTGKLTFEECNRSELASLDQVKVLSFIDRMDYAYDLASVVVGRAGALTISELCLQAKAVILVPLPSAAEDHQTQNAQSLVDKEAAIMVSDATAKEQLVPKVFELLEDSATREKMEKNV